MWRWGWEVELFAFSPDSPKRQKKKKIGLKSYIMLETARYAISQLIMLIISLTVYLKVS